MKSAVEDIDGERKAMSRGKEREHDTISRAHERGSERKLPHTSSGAANKRKATRKAVQNAIGVKIDSTYKKRARLTAARFRMLNEELYTTTSEHHVTMFSDEQHGKEWKILKYAKSVRYGFSYVITQVTLSEYTVDLETTILIFCVKVRLLGSNITRDMKIKSSNGQ